MNNMHFNLYLILKLLIISFLVLKCECSNDTEENGLTSKVPLTKEKYRILFWFPIPIISHQKLIEPLVREMANRGHNVTFITPMPLNNPPKTLNQIVVQNYYESIAKIMLVKDVWQFISPTGVIHSYKNYMIDLFEDPAMRDFLNSDYQFDGIIMEAMVNPSFAGLSHKFKAPLIEMLSIPYLHYTYSLTGIPYDTSYIIDGATPFSDRMTFIERTLNTIASISMRALMPMLRGLFQDIMDRYLRYPGWEQRPDIGTLLSNVSLLLLNSHISVGYPYPLPPHAKEIGGISLPKPKPLPKDLQEWMDSATDGVILFSMGSHLNMSNSLSLDKIELFQKFFITVKQKVLWKWESDEHLDVSPNVKLMKWFPQMDVLGHKNCRLFITHGGFHSSLESIYHGVPVVVVPIYGDQLKNARMLTEHGTGVTLWLSDITNETVQRSIHHVLNNSTYKENAVKRSIIYRDQPESPIDTAVFWIEYVMRHRGAHHLKPAIIWMPWYQQALLDVYAVMAAISVIILLMIYGFFKFIRKLLNCCISQSSSKKKKD